MALTELTKPISRKIHVSGKGEFLVTILPDGVSIRMFRKRKSVKLPLEELAKRSLEQAAYLLTAEEGKDPLRTLGNLGRLCMALGRRLADTALRLAR